MDPTKDPILGIFPDIPRRIDMRTDRDDDKIRNIWKRMKPNKNGPVSGQKLRYVLKYYSIYDQFYDDALEEWSIIEERYDKDTYTSCICEQHNVKLHYIIKNRYNDNYLRIGSICIKKFTNEDMNLVHDAYIERRKIQERLAKRQRV
jgi:hypothetical protein